MSMSFLDELMTEIKNQGNRFSGIVALKKGTSTTLRFLTDMPDVSKIPLHTRFVEGNRSLAYTVPCAKYFGHKECFLCDKDTPFPESQSHPAPRVTKNHFGFIVFDYSDSLVKILLLKASTTQPLEWMASFYEKNSKRQGLLGRDYEYKRNDKSGVETKYSLIPEDPSDFKFSASKEIRALPAPGDRPAIYKYVNETVARIHFPQVLSDTITWPDNVTSEVDIELEDVLSEKDNKPSSKKQVISEDDDILDGLLGDDE